MDSIDFVTIVGLGPNGPVRSFQRTFTCSQTASG